MRLVLETGLALASLSSLAYGLSANGTTSSHSNATTISKTSSRSSIASQSSSLANTNGTTSRMPLPSLATILTGTVGSQLVTETYVPHIFQDYTTLSKEVTTTTILTTGGDPVTVVIGPAGVGWAPYHLSKDTLELPPPSSMPPTSVASLDTNFTTKAISSSSSSAPKVSSSSTLSSFPSGNSTSTAPHGTGASPPSRPTTSSVTQTSSSASASSTSSGGSSRSSSASQSSGSSSSSSKSESTSQKSSSSTSSSSGAHISSSSSSHEYIWPVSYVTTAFNNPKESVTTLSVSGSAAIIYSKETFPGLSTITAPATIQTQVVETKTDGSSSTFIGGIVVGPGGVYWGPPGLPPIPPFPGITPPCIWPFCTGGGGGGGSDPPGDPTPPPPYTPDDPNTPDTNSPTSKPTSTPTSTKESTSESKASSSSSSSSCSIQTKTDFWVSCASGSTSACSTYSTSVVSGCSASAFTTTTASACPLAARVTPDPTMAGYDYSNGEYPIIADADNYDTESYAYTVAQIVSTGVVGPAPTGSSQNTTSTSISGSSSSTTKSQGTITTSSSSASKSKSQSSTSSATSTPTRYCLPYADPHNNVKGECQCSSGTAVTKVPLMTSSGDICGYTTYPSPATTAAPTSTTPGPEWPFTFTDLNQGPIIACKSSSLGNAGGIQYTVCEGDRTTVGTDSSIYSHYTSATHAEAVSSSVSAAAAAASSEAAVPKAACAFSDETLFWTFYVYGIAGSTNWAGDNGDNLHNQENGCGDLTGWSWGKDPNGLMQATFNLPFFMKSGCVERAIASAGGPSGLSCEGDGGGIFKRNLALDSSQPSVGRRFPTDVEQVRERGISERKQAIQVAKREILSDVKPSAPLTKPKRLTARAELSQLFANNFELNSRDLDKRGCLDWLWPQTPNIPEKWWCNCVIPGVDECVQAIQKKGVVGNYPSVFYTSWFGVGDGSWGVQGTKNWAKNNICGRFIDWDGIVVGAWMTGVEISIEKPFGKQGLNWAADKKDEVVDPFLKNLSQAFGEESSGEVYVVMPAGAAFSDKSAWVGWEYPALTRNKKITKIWKVELDISDPTQLTTTGGNPPFTKTVLWTPDMGPSAQEPKGNRNVALPEQVPQDQIPEQWQQSE